MAATTGDRYAHNGHDDGDHRAENQTVNERAVPRLVKNDSLHVHPRDRCGHEAENEHANRPFGENLIEQWSVSTTARSLPCARAGVR